ncbi:MAG TPA: helix-turn-helix transcriptional regulator [Myxococcota bacterium]|nr:helix-turn-helix transcriptional regulator [Myxococcota bacterium]
MELEQARGLSDRELEVAILLSRGRSGKEIAFATALSPSAVSRASHAAARKLGLGSRVELASAFAGLTAPEDAPAPARHTPDDLLSPTERQVAELATRGRTDAEIAAARRTSRRTVANQLQHVYRKLGVHSRTELASRLSA